MNSESIDLIPLEFARKLSFIPLDDFQKFCVGAPKTIFTENIANNRTLVSWLDDNIEVLRYVIEKHNADVNTNTNGYIERFDIGRMFHTTFHMLENDELFDLITSSNTLEVRPIEFSNMIHNINMYHGASYWDFSNNSIKTKVIRLLELSMAKTPDFLHKSAKSAHNLSKTFIRFIFEKLQGHHDEKFKLAFHSQEYDFAIQFIPSVSDETIRDYQLYELVVLNRYVFGCSFNKKLSLLWQCIGARLGNDLTLSDGSSLILLIYKHIIVGFNYFNVDYTCNALIHILPNLTIDWSPVIEYITDAIETKQYSEIISNYMVLFIMIQNGFDGFPDEFLYACVQSILRQERKGYTQRDDRILKHLSGLFELLGVNAISLGMICDTIPHQAAGTKIIEYKGGYHTDLIFQTIPDDSFEKFPEQINAIIEKMRASGTSTIYNEFYARMKN